MPRDTWAVAERRLGQTLRRAGEPITIAPAEGEVVKSFGMFEESTEDSGFTPAPARNVDRRLIVTRSAAVDIAEDCMVVLDNSNDRYRVVDIDTRTRISRVLRLKAA